MKIAVAIIRDQTADEILFRAIMTVGMILLCGPEAAQLVPRSELEDAAGQAQRKSQDPRIQGVVWECWRMIKV
jgi:hypothetical protein